MRDLISFTFLDDTGSPVDDLEEIAFPGVDDVPVAGLGDRSTSTPATPAATAARRALEDRLRERLERVAITTARYERPDGAGHDDEAAADLDDGDDDDDTPGGPAAVDDSDEEPVEPATTAPAKRVRLTIGSTRLSPVQRRHLRLLSLSSGPTDHWRPRHRSECRDLPRPCPYVSCAHHLLLDVDEDTGSIHVNYPEILDDLALEGARLESGRYWTDSNEEPVITGPRLDEMPATCAIDVGDAGGLTLQETADLLQVTRTRLGQILVEIAEQLRGDQRAFDELADYLSEETLAGLAAERAAVEGSEAPPEPAREPAQEPVQLGLFGGRRVG